MVQRGCALWGLEFGSRFRFQEDILLNNRGLQLDFPFASTYLWVLCIDARGLHAAVKNLRRRRHGCSIWPADGPFAVPSCATQSANASLVGDVPREAVSDNAKEIAQKLTQHKLIQKPNDRQKNRRCSPSAPNPKVGRRIVQWAVQ